MPSHQLDLRDVTVSYQRVPAVHHLTLELHCGHRVALLGPNGAGKTSLLKAMVGLVPLETGSIALGGHDGTSHANAIAYLPQRNLVDWDFPATVRGLVEMGRYPHLGSWGRFGKDDHAAVHDALRLMDLTDLADRQISALSGGQQQRAFLARALAQHAHVFLLDEPFTGLDEPAQQLLAHALRQLAEAGHLVIASHHDLKSTPTWFDQVLFLNGELIAFGSIADTFTDTNIRRTFQTPVYSGEHHGHGVAH